jgi:hypothetical protein
VYATKSLPLDRLQALYDHKGYPVTVVDEDRMISEVDGLVSVYGPMRVQPEDVPDEVLALIVPKYSYEFAYRDDIGPELVGILADELDAAVYDLSLIHI